jgi:hypothetical protein
MSNVASLELCKELYGLSGWNDTPNHVDLGYLVRKLPAYTEIRNYEICWQARFNSMISEADTPEDAAAKLAIELFKSGVLEQPRDITESKDKRKRKRTDVK